MYVYFSYHELGIYDLPTIIDYVLYATGREKIFYVGHSEGTTQFLVMTSEKPEYNSKIILMIGLAPAAFSGNIRGPVTKLAKLTYLGVENLTVIIGHVPAGASWKQFVHYGQGYINAGRFRQYDYGDNDKNLRIYNSTTPPDYQLEKITAPIVLFSSDNDWLATTKDVELLSTKLNSIVLHYKISMNTTFNHYDFIWGKSSLQIVSQPILQLLDQYQ
ncbi:lipase 3 [Lasius niger]|uniref:Lipase 3 n=1 Tax=Lasius niger TaxID=67767 RepID=A0A0J7MZJ8_LASNI|nr:lipase 3 [Lasius niger]